MQLRGGGEKVEEAEELLSKLTISPEGGGRKTGNVNIVFIGHVDSGKSTISGHILYDTGGLDERTLEKYEREAKAIGRESWKYAWAMDTTDEERAKGKTQECGRASFRTGLRHYTIIDAPGHKNFVPFMIAGTSQAEIAVLVVSARTGEFEAGFDRGGQTREHAILAKTAGVSFLVVAVNKMDEVSWGKQRFDEMKEKLEPFLKTAGFNVKTQVAWVPLEGLSGTNLKASIGKETCDWYDGPSLLGALDAVKLPERDGAGDLRMSVADRYRDSDMYAMGKIFQGTLNKGQTVVCQPGGSTADVVAITVDGEEIPEAKAGDNVQVRIRTTEDDAVQQGGILCSVGGLCPVVTEFEAKLNVLACKTILSAGYKCVLHLHNAVVECTWVRMVGVVDKKTGKMDSKLPFVRQGQQAVVRVETDSSVCAELYKDLQQMGRFVMREEGLTVAVGVISQLGIDPVHRPKGVLHGAPLT